MPGKEKPPDEKELLFMQAELSRDMPTLDLHGQTVEQAQNSIDRFLYEQFTARKRTVKIMHGKGTGVLQKTTGEFLASHPLVLNWRNSSKPGEEGAFIYAILAEKEE